MDDKIKGFLEKANAGDAVAQYNMGQYYMMDGNHEDAAEWWRKAAQQGLSAAQFNLALFYLNCDTGLSASENILAATSWTKMAAKQGHEQAVALLADLESETAKIVSG